MLRKTKFKQPAPAMPAPAKPKPQAQSEGMMEEKLTPTNTDFSQKDSTQTNPAPAQQPAPEEDNPFF